MAYTPGPWNAVQWFSNRGVNIVSERMFLCEISKSRDPNFADDARLMAAAPRLLEALQAVYDELPEEGISTRHSTRVAAAKALAAIAQAKGEAA